MRQTSLIPKRSLSVLLLGAVSCVAVSCLATSSLAATVHGQSKEQPSQEFYELRIYKVDTLEKQKSLLAFLKDAYLPAVKRIGIDRVGVFTVMKREGANKVEKADAASVFVLLPFKTENQFSSLRDKLNADKKYQAAAKKHFDRPLRDPVFKRVESRFLKAFKGMPVIEQPAYSTKKSDRIFELRLYESHTEDHARRKVAMFNDGEIDLMKDLKMGPIFFGETLIGQDVPNLIYMLSAENMKAHQGHWRDFIQSPVWKKMSKLEIYKDTVSGIKNWYLVPTDFSDL